MGQAARLHSRVSAFLVPEPPAASRLENHRPGPGMFRSRGRAPTWGRTPRPLVSPKHAQEGTEPWRAAGHAFLGTSLSWPSRPCPHPLLVPAAQARRSTALTWGPKAYAEVSPEHTALPVGLATPPAGTSLAYLSPQGPRRSGASM